MATFPISVHTTGTVDWDADHTTPAITQVGGPVSRIAVDTGTKVKTGDPLLYILSPDG
jgi:multidrug resistance efflux pump